MLQRISRSGRCCKIIAAIVISAPIACSGQILPQLVAQIESFDHDHAIVLYATSNGVDLVLAHDEHVATAPDVPQSLSFASAEPAHVIHFVSGPSTMKDSVGRALTYERQIAAYVSSIITNEWRTFVPQMPIAYSLPPPAKIATLPIHRSTLLLI